MTIAEWGSVGEAVSAVAVVVTLAYLAVQLRQNTRAMDENRRALVSQRTMSRSSMIVDRVLRLADSTYLADILRKLEEAGWPENSAAPREVLDATEFVRMREYYKAETVIFGESARQFALGFEDAGSQEQFERNVAQARARWESFGVESRNPHLVQLLERLDRGG